MPPDSKADVNDRVKSWILRPDAKCSASMRARLRGIYCKKSHTKRGKLVIAPNSAGKSYLCRGNPEFIDQDNVLPPWLRKAPRTDLVIQLIVAVSLYFVVTQGRIVVGECWWHPSEVDLFWQPHLDTILERNKCKPILDQFTEDYLRKQYRENKCSYEKYSGIYSIPLCTYIEESPLAGWSTYGRLCTAVCKRGSEEV